MHTSNDSHSIGGDWLPKTFWSGMEGWYRLISARTQ
jgi:hypothetical protein